MDVLGMDLMLPKEEQQGVSQAAVPLHQSSHRNEVTNNVVTTTLPVGLILVFVDSLDDDHFHF